MSCFEGLSLQSESFPNELNLPKYIVFWQPLHLALPNHIQNLVPLNRSPRRVAFSEKCRHLAQEFRLYGKAVSRPLSERMPFFSPNASKSWFRGKCLDVLASIASRVGDRARYARSSVHRRPGDVDYLGSRKSMNPEICDAAGGSRFDNTATT